MNQDYDAQRFYFSLWPPIAGFVAFSALMSLWTFLTSQSRRTLEQSLQVTAVTAVLYLICFGLFVIVIAVFNRMVPTRVGPVGIDTYNGFGVGIKVRWTHIDKVSRLTLFPGFSFLWLSHGKNIFTAAYITTFLTDPRGFHRAVVEYAGADHPLAVAFERYM